MAKAYFMKSKMVAYLTKRCDKCGRPIYIIGDSKGYWNPSRRARDKNICDCCYAIWRRKKDEAFAKWSEVM